MCTPPFLLGEWGGGGGVVGPPAKFSERGVLAGPHLLEGGYWEREGDFFLFSGGGGGVAIFTQNK